MEQEFEVYEQEINFEFKGNKYKFQLVLETRLDIQVLLNGYLFLTNNPSEQNFCNFVDAIDKESYCLPKSAHDRYMKMEEEDNSKVV